MTLGHKVTEKMDQSLFTACVRGKVEYAYLHMKNVLRKYGIRISNRADMEI